MRPTLPDGAERGRLDRVSAAAASPHAAATRAGADVLAAGGSAMDAAVAINAMLCVVYPHMCGLGRRPVHALPRRLGRARLGPERQWPGARARDARVVPGAGAVRGARPRAAPVTVPGAVASWAAGLERFGRRPLDRLLEPAARAAEEGFELTARTAGWIAHNAPDLARDPVLRARYLDGDGRPIPAGTTVRQPDLARTLRRLAEAGAGDLYRGALAGEIDVAFRAAGGLLRAGGPRRVRARVGRARAPALPRARRPHDAAEQPGRHGAHDAQRARGARTRRHPGRRATSRRSSPPSASRSPRATACRRPALRRRPARRAALAGLRARGPRRREPGPVRSSAGDTVYLCAVDADGNACSMIESIYYGFGSCFVAGDTGLLMHNRGHYFSPRRRHAQPPRAGKRPLHTLMATMAFAGDDLRFVFGCMGADGQAQTTVQVLERYLAGRASPRRSRRRGSSTGASCPRTTPRS